jgi:hypothetical protein
VTITREQVADLRPGDVVEISWGETEFSDVTRSIRGPLRRNSQGYLYVGALTVASPNGDVWGDDIRTLTVVSRAPRPLYVNHDRAEPVPGDVVRDADTEITKHTWVKNVDGFSNEWLAVPGHVYVPRKQLPDRLRLLVDGETGMPVQP